MHTLLRDLEHPVAIAMWDLGWLLRHYEGGGFEDWDKALDALTERGYNAIRIDCFPHLVACETCEEFDFRYDPVKCSLWHNQIDTHVNARAALKEFLPKCFQRGIYVALSTWIQWPVQYIRLLEKQDLIDAWDKTLEFLRDNDLLHNILYVDFLNEYPYCHGFVSLKRYAHLLDGEDIAVTESTMQEDASNDFGAAGNAYLKNYSRELSESFSRKWPGIDFGVCVSTFGRFYDHLDTIDFSAFGFLDIHLWMVYKKGWFRLQELAETADSAQLQQQLFRETALARQNGSEEIVAWMDKELTKHEVLSRLYKTPIGNTEGWGTVSWPPEAANWDFIKWAGEQCVELSIQHNFSFICTSNFTHPFIKALWNDVQWHQALTEKIKNATVSRFWLSE